MIEISLVCFIFLYLVEFSLRLFLIIILNIGDNIKENIFKTKLYQNQLS